MGTQTKLWVKGLKWLLIVVIAFYTLPFIIYLIAPSARNFMYEQVLYKPLTDSLTKGCKNDSAKAMHLFEYLGNNCRQPQGNENPKYEYPHQVLQNKVASCDQQVWLLMHLLRVEDIDAEMVFLYGYDSVSHHTVAAVEITPGNKAMFDPFNKLYFIDGSGRLASIGDIMKGNVNAKGVIPPGYFKLYETKYDFKSHANNLQPTINKAIRTLLLIEYTVFGRLFTGPFEALH